MEYRQSAPSTYGAESYAQKHIDEGFYSDHAATLENAGRSSRNGKKRVPRRRHRHIEPLPQLLKLGIRRLEQWPVRRVVIFEGVCFFLTFVCVVAVIVHRTSTHQTNRTVVAQIVPSPSSMITLTPTPNITAIPTQNPLDGIVIKRLGETNDLLPAVQERLTELYYMDMPEGGYTGSYDSATKIGVLLFQIKNYEDSTQWDGQLGAGTYALMMSDQAKAYYLGRGDGDDRTKIITKLVQDVKKLQDRLIALGYMSITRASGYYGSSTVDAVLAFQQFHGLSPDGRAGYETLALLYSEEAMDYKTGKQNDKSKLTPTPSTVPVPMV